MSKDLIVVLVDINAAYAKIFALGKKKHGYLVTMKFKEVEPLLKEESDLVAKIEQMENRRRSILVKMAGTNKELRADMTMAELIAFVPASGFSSPDTLV